MKDDETKNEALLKDGLKELIESYSDYFSTLVKNELKQPGTSEKKYWIQKFVSRKFFWWL